MLRRCDVTMFSLGCCSCLRGEHPAGGGRGALADRDGPGRWVDQVNHGHILVYMITNVPLKFRSDTDSLFRVRRLNVSHLDPMPEGFVPTSYIETTEMFDQPQPV